MLPAESRLRRSEEFRTVVRSGVRVGRASLVLHVLRRSGPPSRAGFIVPRAVGNAVTRNRVRRRLRHLLAASLPAAPLPLDVVVRALPAAASADLAADFGVAWSATLRRLEAAA